MAEIDINDFRAFFFKGLKGLVEGAHDDVIGDGIDNLTDNSNLLALNARGNAFFVNLNRLAAGGGVMDIASCEGV